MHKPTPKPSALILQHSAHSFAFYFVVLYTLDEKNKLDFTVNDKTYRALQLHFHWGTAEITDYDMSYRGGSEHTVNGKHYPVEVCNKLCMMVFFCFV